MEFKSDKTTALKNTGNHTSENPMNFVGNFEILDLSKVVNNHFFSFHYSRKTFYTATLLQGNYTIEFEDQNIELTGNIAIYNFQNSLWYSYIKWSL